MAKKTILLSGLTVDSIRLSVVPEQGATWEDVHEALLAKWVTWHTAMIGWGQFTPFDEGASAIEKAITERKGTPVPIVVDFVMVYEKKRS